MKQQTQNINKQLQTVIGNLIGKDYFKLEFGCKVNIGKKIRTVLYVDFEKTIQVDRYPNTFFEKYEYEIIGQEPTLNDVLLAIGDKYIFWNDGIYDLSYNSIDRQTTEYDLSKFLFNQSTETKLAILKLLE